MQRYFKFIFFITIISCSGLKTKNKGNVTFTKHVNVHPGKIVQVFLPNKYKDSSIKCSNGVLPVSLEKEVFFIYTESYFSDMKDKTCIGEGVKITLSVDEKIFPFEELRVDRKRVNLNKKDLKRVILERKILKKVYSNPLNFSGLKRNFELPLSSKITSEYGKRRLYNKEKKGQHLGIDFRAKVGKEIAAANDGIVVLAKNLFYTGNTVIIYHGLGIFTVYGHLSKKSVERKQRVLKGQIVGLAGKTGRVTGPHLHWGVKVNGQWVNGKDLLAIDFKY